MNRTHELKTLPQYFQAVSIGDKTFKKRKNDRDFHVGDYLILKEWNDGYTGREITAEITYITDYEQKDGYVVMAIQTFAFNQQEEQK